MERVEIDAYEKGHSTRYHNLADLRMEVLETIQLEETGMSIY